MIFAGPQELPATEAWTVWLDATTACRPLLSRDEAARADRFVNGKLTKAFEVSHGVLRALLARYLKCGPHDLEFEFGPAGKPALRGGSPLRFNMSHSGGMAAYVFAFDCEIGIDIEHIHDMPDLESIAERFFCAAETAELLSIAGKKQRLEAFFRCWTRKESSIKALGGGRSIPLDQFQVTLLADSPARLVHVGNDAAAASAWTLHHLEPAPGYVGSVAYRAGAGAFTVRAPRSAQDILGLLV